MHWWKIFVAEIQMELLVLYEVYSIAAGFHGHSFSGSSPEHLLRSSEFKLTAPVEELGDFPSHLS